MSQTLLIEMMQEVDRSLFVRLKENLKVYPRFLKASDIFEIFGVILITSSAIITYFEQTYPEYNISVYAGVCSTCSLSFTLLSRYCNKEAQERQMRINNILHSLKLERPPVVLGLTESNV
jgi:hypothetical protein